jgi:hypothetical protein
MGQLLTAKIIESSWDLAEEVDSTIHSTIIYENAVLLAVKDNGNKLINHRQSETYKREFVENLKDAHLELENLGFANAVLQGSEELKHFYRKFSDRVNGWANHEDCWDWHGLEDVLTICSGHQTPGGNWLVNEIDLPIKNKDIINYNIQIEIAEFIEELKVIFLNEKENVQYLSDLCLNAVLFTDYEIVQWASNSWQWHNTNQAGLLHSLLINVEGSNSFDWYFNFSVKGKVFAMKREKYKLIALLTAKLDALFANAMLEQKQEAIESIQLISFEKTAEVEKKQQEIDSMSVPMIRLENVQQYQKMRTFFSSLKEDKILEYSSIEALMKTRFYVGAKRPMRHQGPIVFIEKFRKKKEYNTVKRDFYSVKSGHIVQKLYTTIRDLNAELTPPLNSHGEIQQFICHLFSKIDRGFSEVHIRKAVADLP